MGRNLDRPISRKYGLLSVEFIHQFKSLNLDECWPIYVQNTVMESQNRTRKLPKHSFTLNAFLSPKGSGFGLTYFKEICSSSSLVCP